MSRKKQVYLAGLQHFIGFHGVAAGANNLAAGNAGNKSGKEVSLPGVHHQRSNSSWAEGRFLALR